MNMRSALPVHGRVNISQECKRGGEKLTIKWTLHKNATIDVQLDKTFRHGKGVRPMGVRDLAFCSL